MSFAKETENIIELAIKKEYESASKKHGEHFNSLHEGYAVLLEEIEEAESENKSNKELVSLLWAKIKSSEKINLYTEIELINKIKEHVLNEMKEWAQVGAMLRKLENTYFYLKGKEK